MKHIALIVLLGAALAACGGGNDGGSNDDAQSPAPVTPPVAAAALRIFPAVVDIDLGRQAQVLVTGAVDRPAWTSSAASVVTVDATGMLQPVGRGTAVVTASSGGKTATATVNVYDLHAAAPDLSSEARLRDAVRAGRLDADLALLYRVYAAHGDERLPAEFRGPSELQSTTMLMREAAGRMASLSAENRAALRPFFLPPIYAESAEAQRFLGAAPAAGAAPKSRPARLEALSESCVLMALGARVVSTAHFNVWVVDFFPLALRNDVLPRDELASLVGSMLEEIYAAQTGLLQRFPRNDNDQPCNGGDGAIDIYLTTTLTISSDPAATTSYPVGCNAVPAFMKLNYVRLANDTAPGLNPALARSYWKSVIAHEMMHLVQFGMNRPADCSKYTWIDEATAEWAMDFIAPDDDWEDGIYKATRQRRSGQFFANYLFNDRRSAIEDYNSQANVALNGYSDYLFFQYVTRKKGDAAMRSIFDAMTRGDGVQALYDGLAGSGGMDTLWHEFALVLWNDPQNTALDTLAALDRYDLGLVQVFAGSAGSSASPSTRTRAMTLSGGAGKLDLLQATAETDGGFRVVPRSVEYEHIRFSDDSASVVKFTNGMAGLGQGKVRLQVVMKIGGRWRPVEDWSDEDAKSFCRDKQDERLEEVILVLSSSENVPPAEGLRFREPIRLSASNVGCWRWQGSATRRIVTDVGGQTGDYVADVRGLVFEARGPIGDTVQLFPIAGMATGRSVVHTASPLCDITIDGPATPVSPLDGQLWLKFGLDAAGLPSTDRRVVNMIGNTFISSRSHAVCPEQGIDQTQTVVNAWGWLLYPLLTRALNVSDDGRKVEAAVTEDAGGVRTIHNFTFTAQRQ